VTEAKRIESDEIEESKAPLMSHLLELRSRLIKCVLAVVIGCVLCIPFLKQIIQLLMWPFEQAIIRYNVNLVDKGLEAVDLGLIATHPLETFFVKLKIALFEFALNQQTLTGGEQVDLLTKISDYLKLATTLFLAFGLSFQLPVILSLLGRAGIVTSAALKGARKYALFGIAVFAAFVTPPDPITQIVLGAAIYLLYEISILSVSLLEKKVEADAKS